VDRSLIHKDRKLLIVAQLPPPVHGAAVVNAMVVNSSEIRRHFIVRVVPIDVAAHLADLRKFSVMKVLRSLVVLSKIVSRVVFDRPHVCYLTLAPHGYAFFRDCLFIAVFRVFRLPHVIHLHGRGMAKSHRGKFAMFLTKFALRKATIIHLSPLLMEDIASFVEPTNIRFVANGVVDPYCGRQIQKLRSKVASILFLSTMLESKGPLVLLEALSILKHEGLPFKAIFAGPWRGSLNVEEFNRYLQEAELTSDVQHVGPVYGDAKNAILRNADILAFPTHYENEAFPLVVLEGMAAGLVPVTSNIAALPDMVGDVGFVVPPKDPVVLAQALGKLLRDPELLATLQQKSRTRYEARFTNEHFEHALAEILVAADVERKVAMNRTS
jgi:glycosyltransferase involved in cell wall biosynthesis